jgi:hypothetical protein
MALIAVGTVDSLHAAYLFVNYLGRGTLHMDEVTVVADVRTTLTSGWPRSPPSGVRAPRHQR